MIIAARVIINLLTLQFKRYVNKLRGKSTVYKKKRQEVRQFLII